MPVNLLGIRHHGPGSCRHVLAQLNALKPDLILVEGPSEAQELLPFVADPNLKPPVAILAYQSDSPQNSVFYPFATFSPEWQCMKYSVNHNVPLRFFDLPLSHTLGIYAQKLKKEQEQEEQEVQEVQEEQELNLDDIEPSDIAHVKGSVEVDPINYLAKANGYEDAEQWWHTNIEMRLNSDEVNEAILKVMLALREEFPEHSSERDLIREAWMRKSLRAAIKEGFNNIAVVCGAWHTPSLHNLEQYKVKDDNALLKGLPKVKVGITWVPWTYSRLSYTSGYGAGISSPGYYEHLYQHPDDDGVLWLTHVANVLRKDNIDVSVAHVLESVRLAQTLAAFRAYPRPSLAEFNEAVTTVMGFGDNTILKLVYQKLIVQDKIGKVPPKAPKVPLLADIELQQKRLRLPFNEEKKTVNLDLRKEIDLNRSIFFFRLALLNINWAKECYVSGKGTFKEGWELDYKPSIIIDIIEKAIYGSNLETAVTNYTQEQLNKLNTIGEITKLLQKVRPCNLPKLVDALTQRLEDTAATSSDALEMLVAIKPLVEIIRYGDVRNFDSTNIEKMLGSLLARINAGGILFCINIDYDSASKIVPELEASFLALNTLNNQEYQNIFYQFLTELHSSKQTHPLINGSATRLLRNAKELSDEMLAKNISYYTSLANNAPNIALWLEGLLSNTGTLLVLDDDLWAIVNQFIAKLDDDNFQEILPILRRTFSTFSTNERQQLGNKAKHYDPNNVEHGTLFKAVQSDGVTSNIDTSMACNIIPLISSLLGVNKVEQISNTTPNDKKKSTRKKKSVSPK